MSSLKYIKIGKLVSKVKDGDSQAFADLYSLTYQRVYLLSLSILKNKSMAEDAVQDIFIIVLKSIHKLDNPRLYLAWLNRITYNYCISELSKSRKLGEVSSDNILAIAYDESENNDPLDSYILKESSNELISLINKLSLIHSTILILRYFQELKISEIAYVLNISEGTVKSRLSNAKKNLRKLYVAEKEKDKTLYGFMLYPLFKKASNDTMLNLNSSANIFNDIVTSSDNNFSDNVEFKPATKDNIATYLPLPITSSIAVVTFLLCSYGIIKYTHNTFDNTLSNLAIYRSHDSHDMNILDNSKDIDILISDTSKPTNKSIPIDIKLKNKSIVDEMYIENSKGEKVSGNYIDEHTYRFKITKNGDYKLFVKLKNNSPIVENFKISCIDTDSPDIIDYSYNNNEIVIKFEDFVNNIDFNKIDLKDSNGKTLNIQSIDKTNNSITIKVDDTPLYLTIFDDAGNEIVYTIKNI